MSLVTSRHGRWYRVDRLRRAKSTFSSTTPETRDDLVNGLCLYDALTYIEPGLHLTIDPIPHNRPHGARWSYRVVANRHLLGEFEVPSLRIVGGDEGTLFGNYCGKDYPATAAQAALECAEAYIRKEY